ncbi:MAG TPA: hypothetical protein VH165_22030 [Kofleriaceae bacterium]|nr:hypothetical protein [Kofleriaceae bacterium]
MITQSTQAVRTDPFRRSRVGAAAGVLVGVVAGVLVGIVTGVVIDTPFGFACAAAVA